MKQIRPCFEPLEERDSYPVFNRPKLKFRDDKMTLQFSILQDSFQAKDSFFHGNQE